MFLGLFYQNFVKLTNSLDSGYIVHVALVVLGVPNGRSWKETTSFLQVPISHLENHYKI